MTCNHPDDPDAIRTALAAALHTIRRDDDATTALLPDVCPAAAIEAIAVLITHYTDDPQAELADWIRVATRARAEGP